MLAFPLMAASAWGQAATTIREAAAAAGLNFGIATNSGDVNNATYAAAAKSQFDMVVCENEMKFESTENPIGTFKYNGGDAVSTFAVANNMKMRGHNFIWHSQSSSAAGAVKDRATGLTVMRNHIEAVGGHFKTKIYEWDVLNETYSGGTGSLWYKIGADYTDSALAISRRVLGTSGYLYSNDYGADGVNSKSTAILNIAKKWLDNDVPLDGIGFQCHLNSPINKNDISANIKRFGDLGLRVSLTEIDIKNATATDWTNLVNACLENFNCVSFVTWGLSDSRSWIGSNCGCLLYNGNPPTAKANMVQAVIDALNKADPTIAAKRKQFTAKTPGTYGGPVGIHDLSRPIVGRGAKYLFGASPTPVFSTGSGAVDPLGRAKTLAPAKIEGLQILAP
jgi:endo-1,4-beta-xylanase